MNNEIEVTMIKGPRAGDIFAAKSVEDALAKIRNAYLLADDFTTKESTVAGGDCEIQVYSQFNSVDFKNLEDLVATITIG